MRFYLPGFIICLFTCTQLHAQDIDVSKYKEQYQLHIKKTTQPVKIDGLLDDAAWQTAEPAKDFWLKFPRDDAKANHKTEVKVSYDNNFLYVGGIIYDSLPLIGQSLKRDSRLRENDGLGVILDPMNKKTNGFYFSVTSFNVQADDLVSATNGGELSFSWDNKWFSATKMYTDHYTVEMAIPFKTLRYDTDNKQWGINFIHSDRKTNEFHTWTRVPVNFPGVDLGYLGALQWDAAPPKAGSNMAFIPYMTGGVKQNKENNEKIKGSFNAGFDAKLALNSSLNLDVTVNPDFSQVEVDRQVTNISRFDIFFPERRNFFLENSDLFADFGIPPVRPFYSRRIGLDPDANPIPILGGIRLTGNVASRTRIGIMSMQTKATDTYASQNYSAATVQQQVLKRSTFKGYFLNREGFFTEKNKLTDPLDKYGRNAGGEFLYTSENGNINGWAGFHHAMKPGISKENSYLNFGGQYAGRRFSSVLDFNNIGKNYYADMGFVQRIENYDALRDTTIRVGTKFIFNENTYRIFPKANKKINQHNLRLENFYAVNPDNTFNESSSEFSYGIDFQSTASIGVGFSIEQTQLLFPTAFTDADPLPAARYKYNGAGIEYESDKRKKLSYSASFGAGQFYNGDIVQAEAGIIFRHQPWITVELNAEYNKLSFPAPYGSADLFLLANRTEINFSNSIFWTTFIQYNTQANNFNINSRLQWRYRPVSDLFIVYTDNYFSDPLLKNKNRSLVFKLSYWL
jgi:Domain of unknown function (DUF5916)/Carbohydrate family 9 binding domain-like